MAGLLPIKTALEEDYVMWLPFLLAEIKKKTSFVLSSITDILKSDYSTYSTSVR